MDKKIYHKNSENWRGPGKPYYNIYDPYLYSLSIQYTINRLKPDGIDPYPYLTEDSIYGSNTTMCKVVSVAQRAGCRWYYRSDDIHSFIIY
jgi:hypothetical protein